MKPILSVILPCYNPAKGWKENVVARFGNIKSEIPSIELVVVNDGSTKNVAPDFFRELTSLIPEFSSVSYSDNHGKGDAIREGVKQAKGEFIIYTDIDFPYTHESFMKIYSALKDEKAEVVIGIRGEGYYTHLSKSRAVISKVLRLFIRKFFHIPTDDTQCGLKGMNQKGKQVFLQTTIDRYLFDLEFIFLSAKQNLKIKTVEVELRPNILLSKMSWKILLQEFGNFLKIFTKTIF